MKTKIKKWGNSLAIRLPKEISTKYHLEDNSEVTIDNLTKVLRIKILPTNKKTLKDLVDAITPENLHKLENWGKDRGKENIEVYKKK